MSIYPHLPNTMSVIDTTSEVGHELLEQPGILVVQLYALQISRGKLNFFKKYYFFSKT